MKPSEKLNAFSGKKSSSVAGILPTDTTSPVAVEERVVMLSQVEQLGGLTSGTVCVRTAPST